MSVPDRVKNMHCPRLAQEDGEDDHGGAGQKTYAAVLPQQENTQDHGGQRLEGIKAAHPVAAPMDMAMFQRKCAPAVQTRLT